MENVSYIDPPSLCQRILWEVSQPYFCVSSAPIAATVIATSLAKVLYSSYPSIHGIVAGLFLAWRTSTCSTGTITLVLSSHIIYKTVTSLVLPNVTKKSLPETGSSLDKDSSDVELPPLLFPSRTTHRRLYPKPYSFAYSYLLVGVPVTRSPVVYSPLLSANTDSSYFSVNAEDYLLRGSAFAGLSLRDRLDIFLVSEGVDSTSYPYAYFVTAPRFLGFSFNPVSFWFLYNGQHEMVQMIFEVNNTFDERRMYLSNKAESSQGRFSFAWDKDFHVSPFNDREGVYTVSVVDVKTGILDVTITLSGREKGDTNGELKPKIVARIYSTLDQKRPFKGVRPDIGILARVGFLVRYGFLGFLTNVRILKEARILWVKKLQLYYRPEPRVGTTGRNETKEEIVVEEIFVATLRMLAEFSDNAILYTAAAGRHRGVEQTLGSAGTQVKLHVLTPEFYSELARSRQPFLDLLTRVCSSTLTMTDTTLVHTTDPDRLARILKGAMLNAIQDTNLCSETTNDSLTFSTLAEIFGITKRNGLSKPQRPTVCTNYQYAVGRIRLADRLSFGSMNFLGFEVFLVQCAVFTAVTSNIVLKIWS